MACLDLNIPIPEVLAALVTCLSINSRSLFPAALRALSEPPAFHLFARSRRSPATNPLEQALRLALDSARAASTVVCHSAASLSALGMALEIGLQRLSRRSSRLTDMSRSTIFVDQAGRRGGISSVRRYRIDPP